MNAFRQIGQKRTYRERAQPARRKAKGFLEKKRDYVVRARNHKAKQAQLKALKRHAELKNDDEFYFGMENTRTGASGDHERLVDEEKFSADEILLMDSQDLPYLQTYSAHERKKIERLRSSLHGLATTVVDEADEDDDDDDDGGAKKVVSRGKHTVFVDDEHAVESFDPVKFFDTVPEAVNRTYNRPRKSQLAAAVMTTPATIGATTKQRIRRYEELAQRGERLQKMERMKQAMLLRRHLSAGGRVKLVKPKGQSESGVAVYRWSKERKK